jgi:hypothetical protein
MPLTHARRLVAGLAVASAVVLATPVPASAKAATISMYTADVTVPAGADADADAGTRVSPILWASAEVTVQKPTLIFQVMGGLSGVTLEADDSSGLCENNSPTTVTCLSAFPLDIGPEGAAGYFEAYLKATDEAAIGGSGIIRTTLTGRGMNSVSHEARVRVAESVDLTAGGEQRVSAAVGGSFDSSLVVSNSGDKVITGASVVFDDDYALISTERYRNCLYSGAVLRSCTFDQPLAVGKSYAAVMPMKVRADTRAPGSADRYYNWQTPAELEDFHGYLKSIGVSPGVGGTGDSLALVERAAARKVQGDPNPDDNWGSLDVKVTGTNGVDLAAAGAALTGAAGEEITLPVGMRNVGKATLDRSRFGSPAAVTTVTVPDGTTVVGAPEQCYPVIDGRIDNDAPGKPGAAKYQCFSDFVSVAGTEEIYEFELRIDRITVRAEGSVAVNEPCECDVFTGDIDKSNNKAAIVITAGAGGGEGGGDGDGGSLPITGPAGAALAGVGGALLVLGVAAFLLGRHRSRRTFVS